MTRILSQLSIPDGDPYITVTVFTDSRDETASLGHSCGGGEVPEIWLCYVGVLIDGCFNQAH